MEPAPTRCGAAGPPGALPGPAPTSRCSPPSASRKTRAPPKSRESSAGERIWCSRMALVDRRMAPMSMPSSGQGDGWGGGVREELVAASGGARAGGCRALRVCTARSPEPAAQPRRCPGQHAAAGPGPPPQPQKKGRPGPSATHPPAAAARHRSWCGRRRPPPAAPSRRTPRCCTAGWRRCCTTPSRQAAARARPFGRAGRARAAAGRAAAAPRANRQRVRRTRRAVPPRPGPIEPSAAGLGAAPIVSTGIRFHAWTGAGLRRGEQLLICPGVR